MRVFIPFDSDPGAEPAPLVPFDRLTMTPMASRNLEESVDGTDKDADRVSGGRHAEPAFGGKTRYGCGQGSGAADL